MFKKVLTYAGDPIFSADPIRCQFLSDFPGEERGFLSFILRNDGDDLRCQESGSAASGRFRTNDPCALKPTQNLTDAAIGDLYKTHSYPACSCKCVKVPQSKFTFSILEISQGLTPSVASSIISLRLWTGRGRPLRNTPPSWFKLPSSEHHPCVNIITVSFAHLWRTGSYFC